MTWYVCFNRQHLHIADTYSAVPTVPAGVVDKVAAARTVVEQLILLVSVASLAGSVSVDVLLTEPRSAAIHSIGERSGASRCRAQLLVHGCAYRSKWKRPLYNLIQHEGLALSSRRYCTALGESFFRNFRNAGIRRTKVLLSTVVQG